jgi:uncharacterized phage-associated protein
MRFDAEKTIQAAGYILKQHQGTATRLRLLKILYIADRESLRERLRQITSDAAAAMDHGPVHVRTYDVLKGQRPESSAWGQFIAQEGPRICRLVQDPGVSRLSKYEMEKLDDICHKWQWHDDYDLAHATHSFSEWQENKPDEGSSKPIPFDDILKALGLADYAHELKEQAKEDEELDRLLGGAAQS